MDLVSAILKVIEAPHQKSLLQVGAHDDQNTLQLSQHFKHVCNWYEYLKIPEYAEGNVELRKMPFLETLERLKEFDVLLMQNEFHHFPDIWQMWTYDRLAAGQDLLLVEWDLTGNMDDYYSAFQNCRPLCGLTQEILDRFVHNGSVEIVRRLKGRSEEIIDSEQNLTTFFQFLLPDHWRFGEKEFRSRIRGISYPFTMWEGFEMIHIRSKTPKQR
jgi:hypothetical protein